MADSALKHTTTVSLFWSFVDKFGQQIVNLATGIILMRILDPAEYGSLLSPASLSTAVLPVHC